MWGLVAGLSSIRREALLERAQGSAATVNLVIEDGKRTRRGSGINKIDTPDVYAQISSVKEFRLLNERARPLASLSCL
jgi:hypothetical protein